MFGCFTCHHAQLYGALDSIFFGILWKEMVGCQFEIAYREGYQFMADSTKLVTLVPEVLTGRIHQNFTF